MYVAHHLAWRVLNIYLSLMTMHACDFLDSTMPIFLSFFLWRDTDRRLLFYPALVHMSDRHFHQYCFGHQHPRRRLIRSLRQYQLKWKKIEGFNLYYLA